MKIGVFVRYEVGKEAVDNRVNDGCGLIIRGAETIHGGNVAQGAHFAQRVDLARIEEETGVAETVADSPIATRTVS